MSSRARFVDISRYQLEVNAQHLADAGFLGICARSTIGISYKDAFYINNFRRAKEAAMVFGAYHVLYPSNRNPVREVDWFVEQMVVDGQSPDFLVADIELMGGQSAASVGDQAKVFLHELKSRTGLRIIVYTGSWFWNGPNYLGPATPLGIEDEFPLWEAEYLDGRFTPPGSVKAEKSPEEPRKPAVLGKGWTGWKMWQWTAKGVPIGAPSATNMDYNVYNGTEEEFMEWLGLTSEPSYEEKVDALWEAHPELHPPE